MALTTKAYNDLNLGGAADPTGWSLRVGSGGSRSETAITAPTGGEQFYVYSAAAPDEIAVDECQAWMIEAAVSAVGVGAPGEAGARMWVTFKDPTLTMIPPPGVDKYRRVEVRLVEDAGNVRRVALWSRFTAANPAGEEVLSLDVDWARQPPANPRYRIRLKRQRIHTGTVEDYIILQAEASRRTSGEPWWDDPESPWADSAPAGADADPPHRYSQRILVSDLGFNTAGTNEIGFGHTNNGTDKDVSIWENVFVCGTNDTDSGLVTTVLPYWPMPGRGPAALAVTEMPAAAASVGESTGPDSDAEGASREVTVTPVPAAISGYHSSDCMQTVLRRIATGADPATPEEEAGSDCADPDTILATNTWVFAGVRDFQDATATVWVKDRPGSVARSRSRVESLVLPDRTCPCGELQVSKPGILAPDPADDGDWDALKSGCYTAADLPAKFAIRVSEWELDPDLSGYYLNGGATLVPLSSLAVGLVSADLGVRRYVIDPPAVDGEFEYAVHLIDQQLNPIGGIADHELVDIIRVNTAAAPSGEIVISEDLAAEPDFATYHAAAAGTTYKEVHIGIRLSLADWQLLALVGEPGSGGEVSQMVVTDGMGTTTSDIDLADFLQTPNASSDAFVLARQVPFDAPVDVSFVLHDCCGNSQTIGPISVDIDAQMPTAVVEVRSVGTTTWVAAGSTMVAKGDIEVRARVTDENFDPAGSTIQLTDPSSVTIFGPSAFPTLPAPTPPTTDYVFGPITVDTGAGHTITVALVDTAGNPNTLAPTFDVDVPDFYIDPVGAGQSANAVTVSHTSGANDTADDDGTLWNGAQNWVGVRVHNRGASGVCRYRHFIVPACLFADPSNWILITDESDPDPPPQVFVPGGGSARSGNNIEFSPTHPDFPDLTGPDPEWGPLGSGGTRLHTCTAVVLHSDGDPLLIDGTDESANFDTVAGFATVMSDIHANGFWSSVVGIEKIGNRNINVKIGTGS